MPGGLSDGEEVCVIDTPGQTPPGRTPGIHPLGKHPPGQTPLPNCMLGYIPPAHCMLGYTPPAPLHAGIHPPYIEGMTHTCENITFLQLLLWRVKI